MIQAPNNKSIFSDFNNTIERLEKQEETNKKIDRYLLISNIVFGILLIITTIVLYVVNAYIPINNINAYALGSGALGLACLTVYPMKIAIDRYLDSKFAEIKKQHTI